MKLSKEQLSASVGETLRNLRMSRNMSIEQLANATRMGYSQLSRIERGKINTSIYHVYNIITTLRASPYTVIKILFKSITDKH
jgi:transcriptional regulator with XRE-family HTH domain